MKNEFTTPLRWGIIGCGAVTEIKSGPAYQQTAGFELVAVMRRNFAKAKDYANRHNVEYVFANADELINSNQVDAVYVATPPDSHKHYALKVAEAGKPCCVEKPFTPCYEDSLAIYNAFEQKDIPLFVAYYRRSLPRFIKIKHLIESGEIGEVRHILWNYSGSPRESALQGKYDWRTDKKIALGGRFDDLASHGLDYFAFLLGEFEQVSGYAANQQGLYSSYDAVSACWQHKSGVQGCGFWNFGCLSAQDKVEIFGSAGILAFSIFANNPIILKNKAGKQTIEVPHPATIQLPHIENMAKALFENIPHPSQGKSALHTSWVMDKILI